MDIPVISMIVRSGWMGRTIISLLALSSLVTWAIIFNRLYVLQRMSSLNKAFRRKYDGLGKIGDLDNLNGSLLQSPMAQLGRAGSQEFRRIIADAQSHTGVKDWSFFLQNQFTMAMDHLESALSLLIAPLDKGVFLLAMISSIAPFLGLLGTVWGIMNSFYEIGNQGSASLPVVAPGIAEALITTIVGLGVAIPALFFYNYLNHKTERMEGEIEEFKEALSIRLKREILNLLFAEKSAHTPMPPTTRS